MLPRRKRTLGSQVALALVASALLIVAGTPWSTARAADDDETPKTAVPEAPAPQAEDSDRPHDKSLLAPTPADAAVAQKGQAGQPAFYEKWQFWAITGGIIVGAVALVWGGSQLYHSINGGDVRPCNPSFIGCYGRGQ